jgi:tetratricopeptide (TPR) repeat protein
MKTMKPSRIVIRDSFITIKTTEKMKMIKRTIAFTLGLVVMGGVASFAQSLADAKKAIDAEQYQKATSMLKTLVNSQPKEGDVYFNLGRVYLLNEEVDSAKVIFSKGTTADPKNALNFVGLGHADLYAGNAAAAKANFDKAVELGKKDYTTFMYIGRAYFENPKPDYAAALPHLQKADELDSKDKDPETFIGLGDYWAKQIKNGPAYEQYLRALDIDPNIKRVKVQIAMMFRLADGFAEAEAKVNEVIAADPNYGPAYRELAEIQNRWSFRDAALSKAKRAESLNSYKKYMDLTDKSFDSRYRYAQFLAYAQDWTTLTTELATLKADPSNPKSLVINRLKGMSAVENKNFDQAVKSFGEVFAKQENAARLIGSDYLYLGKAYQGVGNDSLAVVNIIKGVELDSTKVEDLAALGQKLFGEKKYALAADIFTKVNSLNSKNPNMVMNTYYLGMSKFWTFATLVNEKKTPNPQLLVEADTAFVKVLTLVPDYDPALWYRVRVNKQLDNAENPAGLAIPFYEKFIELVTVTKPEKGTTPANVRNLIEAYNSLASYYAYAIQSLKILTTPSPAPKK